VVTAQCSWTGRARSTSTGPARAAYDCRIFAATGLDATDGDDHRARIAQRVQRWRFSQPTPRDAAEHRAVVDAAVTFCREHPELTATEVAMRAVTRAVRVN
jgi:hypothetical protein